MSIAQALANIKVLTRQEARELGRNHYFNGVPCLQGHLDFRDVRSSGCMECARLFYRSKTQVNRDIRTYEVGIRQTARELGNTHYFTGLPCEEGHICKRYVNDAKCFHCVSTRNKLKKAKNRKIYLGPPIPDDVKNLLKLEKQKKYRNANKERIFKTQQRYQLSAKGKLHRRKKRQQLWKTDPIYRLTCLMSKSITRGLRTGKESKSWKELVNFTVVDLKQHLENKFTCEMNWDNHGTYWHIDHKRPLSWFKLEDKAEFETCWSLDNLQPLEKSLNLAKNNKYEG